MEYAPKDLESHINELINKNDMEQVNDIFVRMLRAVWLLHSRGYCHQFIEPKNFRLVGNQVRILHTDKMSAYML